MVLELHVIKYVISYRYSIQNSNILLKFLVLHESSYLQDAPELLFIRTGNLSKLYSTVYFQNHSLSCNNRVFTLHIQVNPWHVGPNFAVCFKLRRTTFCVLISAHFQVHGFTSNVGHVTKFGVPINCLVSLSVTVEVNGMQTKIM